MLQFLWSFYYFHYLLDDVGTEHWEHNYNFFFFNLIILNSCLFFISLMNVSISIAYPKQTKIFVKNSFHTNKTKWSQNAWIKTPNTNERTHYTNHIIESIFPIHYPLFNVIHVILLCERKQFRQFDIWYN